MVNVLIVQCSQGKWSSQLLRKTVGNQSPGPRTRAAPAVVGAVGRAPCSAESEVDGRNCSFYTKDTNHTNAALQN